MVRFVIALLLIQTFYCAEFPDLGSHIKLTWNNTSFEQKFDGSQTVSDKDGNVDGFILCAEYWNDGVNGECSYDYSWTLDASGSSGSGKFITSLFSKDDEDYSCLKFINFIGGFKRVYEATLAKKGSWSVTYDCQKYTPESNDYTWIIVGVIVSALVIAAVVFGAMYLKKKKAGKEGQTTGGLLQNA